MRSLIFLFEDVEIRTFRHTADGGGSTGEDSSKSYIATRSERFVTNNKMDTISTLRIKD